MTNILTNKLQELKKENKKAFMPYIMGGWNGYEQTLEVLHALEKAGVTAVEFGMPFTDPSADGEIIAKTGFESLESGSSVKGHIAVLKEFRKQGGKLPIIWMGYYNPIFKYGLENFAKEMQSVNVSAVIVPDVPLEESQPLKDALNPLDIALVTFLTSTTTPERFKKITLQSECFIYLVAFAGITGSKTAENNLIANTVSQARTLTDVPLIAGFGISTPQKANELNHHTDGVIIGSALIKAMQHAHTTNQNIPETVYNFCKDFV